MKSISEQEIIAELGSYMKDMGLKEKNAEGIFGIVFEMLETALVCDDRIEIRGLGSMVTKSRKARTMSNPKSNRLVLIPARKNVYFKASRNLLNSINQN